ncbi:MAG: terminase large subunit domain-containing protein [bacterium]
MRENKLKRIYEILELSKRYPVIGVENIMNVELPDYQQDILERIWTHKRAILLCSRRTGKTFTSAVAIAMKAMLYPYLRIGIVGPVFRQAQTVFQEIESLYKRSNFFASMCEHEPKHGNAEWYLTLKNGSYISCLPFSDNIRSKGFNIVFIDEYAYVDDVDEKVSRIITPMLFTKRSAKSGYTDPTDIGNQLIIASTANFKWNPYYKKVKEFEREIKKGNDTHDIISYDYRDGLRSGLFEEDMVLGEFEKADPLTRQMEYLNIFPDETNGFITYQLLHNKAIDKEEVVVGSGDDATYSEPKTKIEFEQEYDDNGYPTDKYIVAFDDADQGEDNFALAVIKIDGQVKRLVRIIALNNAPVQEKIRLIRDILDKFNVILIVADQRHKNIKDNLAEPYEYPNGKIGKIVVDKDDKEQLKYVFNRFGTDANYRDILKIHNFSGNTNEIRAKHFLSEIEKGRFKIPADPRGGYSSKKEEDAYNEIKKTIHEITSIVPKMSGKYVKFEPEIVTQPKDRWTVCELGCFMADEHTKKSFTNMGSLVLGKWKK